MDIPNRTWNAKILAIPIKYKEFILADKMRGFLAISPERRREIARMGGLAAHKKGVGHKFTQEESAKGGKIGGEKAKLNPNTHRWTKGEASEAGKRSALARREKDEHLRRTTTPI